MRVATVTVLSTTATCLCMTRSTFDDVVGSTELVLEENYRKIAETVIDSFEMFRKVPPHQKLRLKQSLTPLHFHPNSHICRQGTQGHCFYILAGGISKATKLSADESTEVDVCTFRAGDHFEQAALSDAGSTRPFNIISVTASYFLVLSRQDYRNIPGATTFEASFLELLHKGRSTTDSTELSNHEMHHSGNRRITAMDNNNVKNDDKARFFLKKMIKFMAESLWLSLYWKMYRVMLLVPAKTEEFGRHASEILKTHHDRQKCVDALIHEIKHILTKKTFERTPDDINLLVGLLHQKNRFLDQYCQGWNSSDFIMLAKKLRFAHVMPLNKIVEAGQPGSCAFLLLKGSARVYTPYSSEKNKRKILQYEEDLCPGALIGESVLGGITERLQTVQSITPCDVLIIEANDFIAIDERHGHKTINLSDKFSFLREMPLFRHLEPYELFRLSEALVAEQVPRTSLIIKKGRVSESLYFIYYGKFDVISDIDGKSTLASLQRHDYFGESLPLRNYFIDGSLNSSRRGQHNNHHKHLHHHHNHHHHQISSQGNHHHGGAVDTKQSYDHLPSSSYHYLECFDGRAGSALDVLVLHKNHFNLLDYVVLKQLRLAYVSRMKWRAERADIVYEEHRETALMRKRNLEASSGSRPTSAAATTFEIQPEDVRAVPEIARSAVVERSQTTVNLNTGATRSLNIPMPGKARTRKLTVDLSILPEINCALNPITLLATSKNALVLKRNKSLLDRTIKFESIRRPRTSLHLGFASLAGNPTRTLHCEVAMNLCELPSHEHRSGPVLLPFLTGEDTVNGTSNAVDQQHSKAMKPESSSTGHLFRTGSAGTSSRTNMVGTQRIPIMSSYCEILSETEMFTF